MSVLKVRGIRHDLASTDAISLASDGSVTFNGAVSVSSGAGATEVDTNVTGSVTVDMSSYQNFVYTLTGNTTLANPTTEVVGQTGFFVFIQDGTGSRTLSLGTQFKTAGGAGITLSSTAGSIDVVPYVVQAVDSILLGAPQLAFA